MSLPRIVQVEKVAPRLRARNSIDDTQGRRRKAPDSVILNALENRPERLVINRLEAAAKALPLVDLTRLEDDDSEQAITALCRRAGTPFGTVAAVCVFPRFIPAAREALEAAGLRGDVAIATVVNFPSGNEPEDRVCSSIRFATDAGADEIDLVFPWRALRDGDPKTGRELVTACREACSRQTLKVILETGELADPRMIRQAADIAIDAGADFLKTSTGKVPVNATPEAARILLEAIRDSGRDVGCKVSGGVRSTEEAREYLALAVGMMGEDWISPGHFRFGASGLLDDLLGVLGEAARAATDGRSC